MKIKQFTLHEKHPTNELLDEMLVEFEDMAIGAVGMYRANLNIYLLEEQLYYNDINEELLDNYRDAVEQAMRIEIYES